MVILIESVMIFLSIGVMLYLGALIRNNIISKSNRNATSITYFFIIAVHFAISIWNGFDGPIFGADKDALEFHKAALSFFDNTNSADLFVPGWVYSIFLAIIYQLTNESWLIGCMLSTICFAFLCLISIKLYNLLTDHEGSARVIVDSYPNKIIIFMGLIPSSIIITSITLREVYQMFFLSGVLLYSVKYMQTKKRINILYLLLNMIALGSLHAFLVYFLCIYLLLFTCFQLRYIKIIKNSKILIAFLIISILLMIDINFLYELIAKFIQGTDGAEDARAYYGFPDISANIFSIVGFIGISFFNYMIRPFPWEISSYIDIATFCENMIRLLFIWRLYVLRRFMTLSLVWVVIAALLLEIMWSIGTVNWGTAQRHHLIAWPLLVIAYFAVNMLKIRCDIKNRFESLKVNTKINDSL